MRLSRLVPARLGEVRRVPQVYTGRPSKQHNGRIKPPQPARSRPTVPPGPTQGDMGRVSGRDRLCIRTQEALGTPGDSWLAPQPLPHSPLTGSDCPILAGHLSPCLHQSQVEAGLGMTRPDDQGACHMSKAAFGLSIKAGAGRRAPQRRPAPPQKEPGALGPSCCPPAAVGPSVHSSRALGGSPPPQGWLKVLVPGRGGGPAEFCR